MKTLSLYHPRNIETAFSEFDRCMESIFRNNHFSMPDASLSARLPSVDVRETEKSYILVAELPGYDEKEVEINLDNNILVIESKKEESNDGKEVIKDETYLLRERRSSTFKRSFKLPENADSEAIKATFKNGILSIDIGKKAEAMKKQIQISAA